MFFDENDQKRRYQHEFDFSNLKLVQSINENSTFLKLNPEEQTSEPDEQK
jgi:hypothetical protein